jgi:hypothetical protein
VAVITDAEDQIAAAPIGERRYVAKQLGYSLGKRVVELEFEVEVLALGDVLGHESTELVVEDSRQGLVAEGPRCGTRGACHEVGRV